MKILAVLWTVCLVRFCSAGCWSCCGKSKTNDGDNEPYGGSEDNLSSLTPSTAVPQSSETSDSTLDLAKPNESKIDIVKDGRNGVEKNEYYPKDASN